MQPVARPKASGFPSLKTALFTSIAMTAFAANSIICREVLKSHALDAASFTSVRIIAGALTLHLLARIMQLDKKQTGGRSRLSALMLSAYALAFSFAYIELNVATGALLLFGSVQATMMLAGICTGERLNILEWIGFFIAIAGFLLLVYPGLSAPSLSGAVLMVLAGMAWGFYSLLGRGSQNPINDSSANFLLAAPVCVAASLMTTSTMHITTRGMLLAAVSGALTTGCAYVIWYRALNDLTVIRASIVQLSVPVLAALGGIVLLFETLSLRLVIAGILILGGVAVGLGGVSRRSGTA